MSDPRLKSLIFYFFKMSMLVVVKGELVLEEKRGVKCRRQTSTH